MAAEAEKPSLLSKLGSAVVDAQPPAVALSVDPQCSTLIAPYDMETVLVDLTKFSANAVASGFTETASGMLSSLNPLSGLNALTGKPAAPVAQAKQGAHKLTLETRKAVARLNWMPPELESLYGDLQLKIQSDLLERDSGAGKNLYPTADAMLEKILAAVADLSKQTVPYKFTLYIRSAGSEDVVGLPGGALIIDKPLVENPKLRNKAILALAHEVAHVLQRHETLSAQAKVVDVVSQLGGMSQMVNTLRQTITDPKSSLDLISQATSGSKGYDKHLSDMELQADACALRLASVVIQDKKQLAQVVRDYIGKLPAVQEPQESSAASEGQGLQVDLSAKASGKNAKPSGKKNAVETISMVAGLMEQANKPSDRHPNPPARKPQLMALLGDIEKNQPMGLALASKTKTPAPDSHAAPETTLSASTSTSKAKPKKQVASKPPVSR